MQEIFVKLTCIDKIPAYSEHKSWSQGGSVQTGFNAVNPVLRGHLWDKEKVAYKTGDLLKEVQFI